MKSPWKVLVPLVSILPYIFVFIASLYKPGDLDLGWHLKYGEYFFQHNRILRDNTFSTLMPHFHWANGAWMTDIITYFVFHYGSFVGLTILSALIVTLTFFLIAKAATLHLFDKALLFPLLIYLESFVNSDSFRGQQLSLLFFGVLFFLLSKTTHFSKILFIIPLLFLAWANIHEEFFLGLAVFGIWIGVTLIRNYYVTRDKKLSLQESLFLGIIFILSFAATFVNPFGVSLHKDALSHFGNPLLQYVIEYRPLDQYPQLFWNHLSMLILTSIGIFYFFQKRIISYYLPIVGTSLILLIFAFGVLRYAWPSYLLALPLLKPITGFLQPRKKESVLLVTFLLSALCIFYVTLIKMPFSQYSTMSWKTYCNIKSIPCSPKSAEYLISHNLTDKRLYSEYDWGGWLIWNYPQIKPTIDGRMHLWRDEKGNSALFEYLPYATGKKDIDNSAYSVVYISTLQPLYTALRLKQTWKQVYQDNNAGIFIRSQR